MIAIDKKDWKSFAELLPKEYCGILIIIDQESKYYDVKNHLFYGYVFAENYIYIILDITNGCGMAWKAHKEFDLKNIYWFYHIEFEIKKGN